MDHYDYEGHELLQEAVDSGMIEEGSKAHGIGARCIDMGYESLTSKQQTVYDLHVAPHLVKLEDQREIKRRISGMPE